MHTHTQTTQSAAEPKSHNVVNVCVRGEEQKLKDRLYKLMMTDGNDG